MACVSENGQIRALVRQLLNRQRTLHIYMHESLPEMTLDAIDSELLDILAASNGKKPLRVVTQINTAQEITPLSRQAFKRIPGQWSSVRGASDEIIALSVSNYR